MTDLLDDVLGDRDVGAHDQRRRDQGVAIGGRRELKPAEDIERLAVIDVDSHHARHIGKPHAHVHSGPRIRVAIHNPLDLRPSVLAEQPAGACEGDRNELGRELPGESSCRGASRRPLEPELRRGASDAAGLERRTFERDGRRVLADLRIFAAKDARDAQRTLRVGDHERSFREHAIHAVERPK